MKRFKIAILANEDPYDHEAWLTACKRFSKLVDYSVINITQESWLKQIRDFSPSICVLKPSGITSIYRCLYQERVDVINHDLKIEVFPSYNELKIYENKRFLAYWLMSCSIPHPKTWVFYNKKEALHASQNLNLPIVGKLNIGASGNGVRILRDKHALSGYLKDAFGKGLVARTGPKLGKGMLLERAFRKLSHPAELINRLDTYRSVAADKQIGYVILQEYIEHDFEWRVVRAGDSFFAHKKIKVGDKASGTLLKNYDNPPLSLLSFVKELTDKYQFKSVAVDLFESPELGYLINEIQCMFGQSDGFQMQVNGEIGRYLFLGDKWIFEPGDFAINACYDLRLQYIIEKIAMDTIHK